MSFLEANAARFSRHIHGAGSATFSLPAGIYSFEQTTDTECPSTTKLTVNGAVIATLTASGPYGMTSFQVDGTAPLLVTTTATATVRITQIG